MPSSKSGNNKGLKPLSRAVLSLVVFCLLLSPASCGKKAQSSSDFYIPTTSYEGEILTVPPRGETTTRSATTVLPTEITTRYILRTQHPPEKTAAAQAHKRQSLLLSDIYARGEGLKGSPQRPSSSKDLASCVEYMMGNMLYEMRFNTSDASVAAAGEYKSVEDMFTNCVDVLSIVDLVHYEMHCYKSSTFNSRAVASDGSYAILKRGDQSSSSLFDTYATNYNLAVNVAKQVVSEVLQTLPEGASDKEVASRLMYRLADMCSYDIDIGDTGRSAYGALVLGKTVCEGYAVGYCMLLKAAGIECVGISSSDYDDPKNGAGHAWVALRLDGVIHWADPTWFDGSYTDGTSFYDTMWLPTTDLSIYQDKEHGRLDYPTEEIYKYW